MKQGSRNLVAALILRRVDAWAPAAVSAGMALIVHDAVTARTALLLFAIALLYWCGYTINDYFDAPFDSWDPDKARENAFVGRTIPAAVMASATIAVMGLLVGLFALFGVRGIALLAVGNLAMWSYSVPPVRLKSRPGLDLLAHGAFVLTFPYFVSLVLIQAGWTTLDWLILGLNFLASFAGQLSQQIRDFDVDSRTDSNFTTTFGLDVSRMCLRITTVVTTLIFVAAVAKGIIPAVVIPVAIVCLPALINRIVARPGRSRSARFYNSMAMAALTYSTVVVCSSLLK